MSFTLFPHQEAALAETKSFNRVAYYLDMGLGKTFVGGEKMMQLGSRVNLLVCQKSKVNDWIEHFTLHYFGSPFNFEIYDLTKKNGFNLFFTDETNHTKLGVINYELAFRRKDLLKLENFTLMLDESSMIQNEATKRSKILLKMCPANLILLSGTPTAGKYENLYSQLHLLGWGISKELYWKQYIETEWVEADGFFRKNITGYKNVDRLKEKLRMHGAIFMKSEEVFDLPEQVFTKIMVGTSADYRRFMKTKIVQMPDKLLVGDMALTSRLYARMLCGHYNKNKLEAFADLVASNDERLIVFYNFNAEVDAMRNLIEDRPVSYISGSTKDLTAYDKFDNSITFVQYQAGAMGLNLQKANRVIYFTLPQSSELFEQSKKRVHRIGQERRCFYYYLMCMGSVEEDILDTLAMRKDYTDELFKSYDQRGKKK